MKNWTIDEFIAECTDLRKNQYTYDYSRMPKGICNGHDVRPYTSSWASIVIDDRIINLPHGMIISNGEKLTPIEYVRRLLEAPIHDAEIDTLAPNQIAYFQQYYPKHTVVGLLKERKGDNRIIVTGAFTPSGCARDCGDHIVIARYSSYDRLDKATLRITKNVEDC